MDTDISLGVERFLDFLKECDERYRMAVADETETNNETQDVLHCMELEEHTYHETARLGRKLVEIRQRRRAAKNIVLKTQPVHDWISANQKVIGELQRVLGSVRKEERKQENPVYFPRTDVTKPA